MTDDPNHANAQWEMAPNTEAILTIRPNFSGVIRVTVQSRLEVLQSSRHQATKEIKLESII